MGRILAPNLSRGGFSILEVAVDPSYTIFFLEALQKSLFWQQQLQHIAAGCITILQAVQQTA
jgi:hypothetical protein